MSARTRLSAPVSEQQQASARLDTADMERVDRVAEARGWTRSQTLRHLIRTGLTVEERTQGNAEP